MGVDEWACLGRRSRPRGELTDALWQVLHDLLSSKSLDDTRDADRDVKKDLKIRRGKDGIYVENLVETPINSGAALSTLIEQGNKKRATSATLMNAASSRSHAVVILSLTRSEFATA